MMETHVMKRSLKLKIKIKWFLYFSLHDLGKKVFWTRESAQKTPSSDKGLRKNGQGAKVYCLTLAFFSKLPETLKRLCNLVRIQLFKMFFFCQKLLDIFNLSQLPSEKIHQCVWYLSLLDQAMAKLFLIGNGHRVFHWCRHYHQTHT